MTELLFVDTNILVYSRDSTEKEKQPAAMKWRQALWRSGRARLSAQVLTEYYVTITRKLIPGLPRDDAQREVRDLTHWNPVAITPALIQAAFDAEKRHQLAFWDALIIAAAHEADCAYLLSEDFNAGQDYDGVTAVNPFETEPAALLSSRNE